MSTLEMAVEELKRLPGSKVEEVAALIHQLAQDVDEQKRQAFAATNRWLHCTVNPALMTALSCPTRGPVIVVGEPETSVRPAEIGSDEYLYSCSHATLTNGFTTALPTRRLSAARNPTSVTNE